MGEESIPSNLNYETFHLRLFKEFCLVLFACFLSESVESWKVWKVGSVVPKTKSM